MQPSYIKEVALGYKGTIAMIILGVVLLILAFVLSIARWFVLGAGVIILIVGGVRIYKAMKAKAEAIKESITKTA